MGLLGISLADTLNGCESMKRRDDEDGKLNERRVKPNNSITIRRNEFK